MWKGLTSPWSPYHWVRLERQKAVLLAPPKPNCPTSWGGQAKFLITPKGAVFSFYHFNCRWFVNESLTRERLPFMLSTKGRVLCTEDNADTRVLIELTLTRYGFEIVSSLSSTEAICLAKTQTFDLYLVDNWMPGLSGTDLTKKLREFDAKTPILFYSAAAYESDKEAARLSGAQGYLVKPTTGEELVAEVVRLIAESKKTSLDPRGMVRKSGSLPR